MLVFIKKFHAVKYKVYSYFLLRPVYHDSQYNMHRVRLLGIYNNIIYCGRDFISFVTYYIYFNVD